MAKLTIEIVFHILLTYILLNTTAFLIFTIEPEYARIHIVKQSASSYYPVVHNEFSTQNISLSNVSINAVN